MKNVVHLFSLFVILISCACNKPTILPTFTNDWDEDLYFFSENLKKEHKDLFYQYSETDFEAAIQHLRDNAGQLSKKQIIIELSKIIHRIGDSHTKVSFEKVLDFLPFGVIKLDDGLFISEVAAGSAELLGQQILGVNGVPIETVLDSFRTVIAYENESKFDTEVVRYLRGIDFHRYFQFVDSTATLTLDLANDVPFTVEKSTETTVQLAALSTPLYLKNQTQYYWYRVLTDDNLLYVNYNRCRNRSDLTFSTFTDKIIRQLEEDATIQKLVLDIRLNGGGDSRIAQPLISALEKLVKDGRLEREQIYVVLGRQTFSSAVLNALQLQEKVQPTFIGEPTGGKPSHFGEVKTFSLPNSKLNVRYSTKYFDFNNDEDALYPDVPIRYTVEDIANGADPVLEWIRRA